MSTYKTTPMGMAVHDESESPHYGESTVLVSTEDESNGAFIVLRSLEEDLEKGHIRLDMEQLEIIVKEARKLINSTK